MGYETHLLVLFDAAGTITTAAKIDQAEMKGRVSLSADGRHFAQLELTDDLRNASPDEILTRYLITHQAGRSARILVRDEAEEGPPSKTKRQTAVGGSQKRNPRA